MKAKKLICLLISIVLLLSFGLSIVSCDNQDDEKIRDTSNKEGSDDSTGDGSDSTPGDTSNNGSNENDDQNNNDNTNDDSNTGNNDDNNNNGGNTGNNTGNNSGNTSTNESGSGTINKPSGGSQIPTPGSGNLDEEGDPAVNEYDVANYDLAKYMYPIWKTDISYAENVFVCEYTSNSNLEFQLLYPITEVVSVRSADLQTLYTKGVDYDIVNGKLKVLKNGRIPILEYNKYHFPYNYQTTPEAFPEKNAAGTGFTGYGFFYDEVGGPSDPGMSRYGISVTYRHTAASTVSVPASKSGKFTKLINKIKSGQDIKMVSIGDSITDGWSSSSQVNMLPGCPNYHNMVADYIRTTYNVNVDNVNLAYSGKSTPWALSMCPDRGYVPIDEVCKNNPDLVVIAFGMNDGCSIPTATYIANINSMLNTIKSKCPNAEVVVVGTQLPNPEVTWKKSATNNNPGSILNYHIAYETALRNEESKWTNAAFANATKTHMEMIKNARYGLTGRKTYEDTAGSNSNHPNDYFHRVYAQVVVQTIFGEFALYN